VTYKYDTFISYSHANAVLAEKISKRIRRYRAPKQSNLKKRHLTVFRDVERLTASSRLSEELKKNVQTSRTLILLASPDSAASEYVDDEVGIFLKNSSIDSVIIVLVEGEFSESIPPNLANNIVEPLYIELHKTDNKSFRLETLRIIAALFGVDYAELRREDEALRRRTRNSWVFGTIITMFLIASVSLINSVNPEAWLRVPQPQYVDNIMPVHDIAVNKKDPSVLLYNGFDANWATNPVPEGYYFKKAGSDYYDDNDLGDLNLLALQYFRNKEDTEVEMIAKVEFEIDEEYDGQSGAGTIGIYPAINPNNNEIGYLRTLSYQGKTEDNIQKSLTLQATFVQSKNNNNFNPFALYPWPIDTLAKLKLYSYNSNIKASYSNFLNTNEKEIELEPWEADEGFWEWAEIWNPAKTVFSNIDSEKLVVVEDTLSLVENEDDLWFSIKKDSQWTHFNEPIKLKLGSVYENDKEDISKIIDQLPYVKNKDSLINRFQGYMKGEFNEVYIVKDTSSLKPIVIEFTGAFDSPERDEEAIPQWLFCASESSGWIEMKLPFEINAKHRVLSLQALNSDGSEAILLTNSEGLFRTLDAGQTWEDVNFGEASFIEGDKLKIIVTRSPSFVYVLVDRNQTFSEGENPLFSLKHRNWIERWKAGLVDLLKD
jgi:hypothetical protein